MVISVGSLNLRDRVFLAPMSGVTDLPFRKIVNALGAELTYSEMTASHALLSDQRDECRKVVALDARTGVQLAGYDPVALSEAARICAGRGAPIIDVNFGCPAKKVVNRYCGSALMQDEGLAGKILECVVKSVDVPVTVKMRTGWDEKNRNAVRIARIAEDCGIAMITVHGRTREQKFAGRADWRFIRRVVDAVSVPVIANGDIADEKDALSCLEQSGAAGLMVGRAVIGRPWLVPALNGLIRDGSPVEFPSWRERFGIICEHYDGILSHYGRRKGVLTARKHLAAYLSAIPGGRDAWPRIAGAEEPDAVMAGLESLFDSLLPRMAL